VEAERRGDKVKKVLAILENEAEIVRRIYAMYLGIEGRQFGIKASFVSMRCTLEMANCLPRKRTPSSSKPRGSNVFGTAALSVIRRILHPGSSQGRSC
jgi:hypothetical protein